VLSARKAGCSFYPPVIKLQTVVSNAPPPGTKAKKEEVPAQLARPENFQVKREVHIARIALLGNIQRVTYQHPIVRIVQLVIFSPKVEEQAAL
jgi:hypothetical protein